MAAVQQPFGTERPQPRAFRPISEATPHFPIRRPNAEPNDPAKPQNIPGRAAYSRPCGGVLDLVVGDTAAQTAAGRIGNRHSRQMPLGLRVLRIGED